ncbi:MAG: hypothetical protein RR383_08555, partial [Muribaculaceae bacterium]
DIDLKSLKYVYAETVKSPAPRFYTSVEYALRYVSLLEQGKKLNLRPRRENMYRYIRDAFNELLKNNPKYSRIEAMTHIIYSSAPCFYVSTRALRNIIRKKKSQ